ncbi:hypothetical protein [Rhizobium sophoriradicis]|uniref:hypothetical protein n=1 Tax=Rhizobium sophoriradicis TaxID=1535245 RepID=UPI001FDF1F27|nr:hypothetical protein [Rhizobium sophoriradicis]
MKLTIFDCDGVLVNSEEIYLAAELEFLESIGAGFEPKAYMQSFMGLSPSMWKRSFRIAWRRKPEHLFRAISMLKSSTYRQ